MKNLLSIALFCSATWSQESAPDVSKAAVELPLKTALLEAPTAGESPVPLAGLVRWHPSIDAALSAAARSGRPVLLFQLLGRLDQEFC